MTPQLAKRYREARKVISRCTDRIYAITELMNCLRSLASHEITLEPFVIASLGKMISEDIMNIHEALEDGFVHQNEVK